MNRISTTERFYRASKIHNLYPHINYAHISLPIVHNRTRKINLHDITRTYVKRIAWIGLALGGYIIYRYTDYSLLSIHMFIQGEFTLSWDIFRIRCIHQIKG